MDPPYPILENSDKHILAPTQLELIPFSFEEEDEFRGSESLNMHMYAHDINSQKHLIRITNFPVHLCIKLPTSSYDMHIPDGGTIHQAQYISKQNTIYWDEGLASELVDRFCNKLKSKNKPQPVAHHFDQFQDIYYYCKEEKQSYLYLFFKSIAAKKSFKDICSRYHTFLNKEFQYIQFEIHEEKVSAWLRLMARRNMKYNSWFNVTGREVPTGSEYRISNENIKEYYVDFETIIPIDPKLTSGRVVRPRLIGFDFETFGHRGVKRMTSSMEVKDPIFMISVDFMVSGDPKTRQKYCLCYGESKPVEGAEIYNFKTEQEMLVAFSHLVVYLSPDILMGYNVYRFDWPYLLGRYSIHHIPERLIPTFGCLLDQPTEIFDQKWKSSGYGENFMTFVIASGVLMMDMLPNIKRLYKLRMYSLEFVSRTFKIGGKRKITVAQMFEAFEAYWKGDSDGIDKMTKVADYCIQDSSLVIDLFEITKIWFHLSSLSGEGGVSICDIFLRGEQCRCYSQLYYKCFQHGFVLSNSLLFDYYYTGGYVGKPIPGVYKYVFTLDFTSLYPSIMQAYNLSYDTFIPIWFWPQIPKECCEIIPIDQEEPTEHYSISRKLDIEQKLKLRRTGYEVEITPEEISYYKKSISITKQTLDPENPVEVIDFDVEDLTERTDKTLRHYEFRFIKKQYREGFMPKLEREWVAARKLVKNQIKSLNKTLASLNDEKEALDDDTPEMIAQLEEKRQKITEELKAAQNQDEIDELVDKASKLAKEMSTLDALIATLKDNEKLVNRREYLKAEIEKIIVELLIKDKTQNAIKIVANSGYGFTGVRQGMLSGVFIAICVTAIGRKLVQKANDVLVERFAHLGAIVVYNDTDSSMIACTKIDDTFDLGAIGKEMEEVISGRPETTLKDGTVLPAIEPIFKDPLKMEFEDVCQMCPIKPKYYLKAIRETDKDKIAKNGPFILDSDGQPYIKKKGVLTAKRGNSKFAMKVYEELSNQVLFLDSISNTLKSFSKHATELLMDKFDPRDLTKVTELGSNYVQEGFYMNVFSKNLAKWGNPVRGGDRLEYIIVKTKEELRTGKDAKVGDKCREIGMWEADPEREQIDYEYYIEKGLQTQFDNLFSVGFMEFTQKPEFKNVGYVPAFSTCHFVHFGQPVKMVAAMVKDFMKPSNEKFAEYLFENHGIAYEYSEYPRNYYIASLVDFEIERICAYIEQEVSHVPVIYENGI